ncbi:hypothetical protein LAZ67_16001679, partial [Cordylochernes scorpioides]
MFKAKPFSKELLLQKHLSNFKKRHHTLIHQETKVQEVDEGKIECGKDIKNTTCLLSNEKYFSNVMLTTARTKNKDNNGVPQTCRVLIDSGSQANFISGQGPKIQQDLFHIILRFRIHPVAINADIAKMNRQIRISQEDPEFQRIVWRNDPHDKIKDYRLETVTCGTSCAPFLATRIIKQLALDEQSKFPKASKIALTDLYVDDLVTGTFSVDEGKNLVQELYGLLSTGGFELLVKCVQSIEFSKEKHCLLSNKPIPNKSRIYNLCPFLDPRGIIRVGGRLKNVNVHGDRINQVLLPRSHHLTTLIVNNVHVHNLHSSTQATLAAMRNIFWIPSGRNVVRKILRTCMKFARFRIEAPFQLMGNLIFARINGSRPFLVTGIDFAGPFLIKRNMGRTTSTMNAYVALFICFSTRAIHLELISSLTTDALISTIRRFIARRGKPATIHSDNATNFVGAHKIIGKLCHNASKVLTNSEGIQWKFIPPSAPHFGGLWEAGVKSMKYHLRRTMGSALLNFEELTKLLAQIEACLNSRPLCPLSEDPEDLQALILGHFLIGGSLTAIPDEDDIIAMKIYIYIDSNPQLICNTRFKECRCNQSDVSTCGSAYPSTSSGGPTSHFYRHPATCARHPRSFHLTRTISRRLDANGLHSCRPLRRLPLTPPNRRQRLEWCRARSTWMTEWHRVVFSDESRFCLSSDSRRVRVWRRRGERSNPAAIVERPTVRERGIMVWGAIAYDSRSPLLRIQGTMTAQRYVDDVLRPMLPWPPYSPELSPIEHVWDIIGRRLHALPQPRSEDELWQMVEREWRAIPQDAIRTLIDSLPRRVAACIAVRAVGSEPTPPRRLVAKIDSVLKAFDSHFCVRKNIIYERAKFNSRIQEDREPVDEFITSLYKLADSCEFEGLHEQLIRDRIVVGVRDKALSERMQLDSKLTLEKAVKMVRQQEAVRQQQVDLQRPSTSQKVNQVKFNSKKQSPKQQQQPSRKKEKSAKTRSRCPKCGGFTHREGQACRAEGQKCNLCSKTGHFANCCPDKQAKTAEVKAVSELDEEIGFLLEVSAVEDSSNLDDDERECRRRWTAEIQVNGKKVKFKLDSQADVTCVPLCLFKEIMGQQRLVESDINLRAAEFSELQTVGMFISTLRNGNYEIKEKIFVIRRLSEPLLSRRACELLNLARRIEVVATRINPIKEFPEVFEGLGQIGNPYEIKLKPGAKPYAVHTPRRVPIPLMEKLKTRLEELDKDDILTKIFEAQQEDTTLKAVVNYLEQGWPDKRKMSQALLSYWHVKDELGVQNGLLMRGCRLVIPASMKLEILDKLHAGHFGITKTRLRARETVWWPGISEEIAETVRKCSVCIQEAVSKHEPLIPTNFPTRPWQKIGMDLFKFENKWYLVVIDYYSRFPEVVQLDRLTASVVVRSCKSIFARHGIPETVVSDNGTQFGAAREFANFARQYGFQHVTSSPRFPQSNGMAESGVKIAKLILKKNQDPSLGLLEYRSTPLENGYSPAELLMGRKLRTTLPIAPENLNPKLVDSQTLKRKEGRRRKDMKSRYDRRCGATDMEELSEGDTVWITDMRTWGIVKKKASTPRSYMVDTPVGTLRRNRFHLRKGYAVQYPADPSTPTFSEEDLVENEKTPVVDYPSNDSEDGQIRTRRPKIQQDLFHIILRFRIHPVAINADIAKMNRQIRVSQKDPEFQRIVWRNDPHDKIKDYRLETVTCGTSCAPFLVTRIIKQLALDEQSKFPKASKIALTDFYVDDLVTGTFSVDEGKNLVQELYGLLSAGGFELLGWISPFTTTIKLILQELWKTGLEWDDPIPEELRRKLTLINQNLPSLEHIQIPRCVVPGNFMKVEFHGFCDASQKAYAASLCLKIFNNSRMPSHSRNREPLTLRELNDALLTVVKCVQSIEFSKEKHCLLSNKPIPNKSRIYNLCPFLDPRGIIRVGGRLKNVNVRGDRINQVLLPRSHHLTTLIVNNVHVHNLHSSTQATLAAMRNIFWIPSGRNVVRKILRTCMKYARFRIEAPFQLMGNLIFARINGSRPFLVTGIDFAGPFLIKRNMGRTTSTMNAYVALFICFSTRAIHLELISSLTTDALISTIRRFIARRGKPARIHSDNATNFVVAHKIIGKLCHNASKVITNSEGIQWKFIPPSAPHFGGLWEAGVKSTKYHLRRTMGSALLNFEELTKLLAQIEACLSSRPLCPLSEDPEYLQALIPGHFLIGGSLTALPDEDDIIAMSLSNRWQLIQKSMNHFWTRWSQEYVSQLQQRSRWCKPQPNIKEGSLVLIKNDQQPPLAWKIGRISKVFPGDDARLRVVEVKTANGNYRRPIVKL